MNLDLQNMDIDDLISENFDMENGFGRGNGNRGGRKNISGKRKQKENVRGRKNSKRYEDLDWQMEEEEKLPKGENRLKHPFVLNEDQFTTIVYSVLEKAKEYPLLQKQLENAPILFGNYRFGDLVRVNAVNMNKDTSGSFSVLGRFDMGNAEYLIELNKKNVGNVANETYSKEKLLSDIAHEYTHALQMSLEQEYMYKNKDKNKNFALLGKSVNVEYSVDGSSDDDLSLNDIEKFYRSMLMEADAFTKEKYFFDNDFVNMPEAEVKGKMMNKFKSELTRLSNLYLDVSYSAGYEKNYINMMKSDFKFSDDFHSRMECMLGAATEKTNGVFPRYDINWKEIDGIITNAVMLNALIHIMKEFSNMQIVNIVESIKSCIGNAEKNEALKVVAEQKSKNNMGENENVVKDMDDVNTKIITSSLILQVLELCKKHKVLMKESGYSEKIAPEKWGKIAKEQSVVLAKILKVCKKTRE